MNELVHSTYMTKGGKFLPFCPGCGHERLLKELDRALTLLQLDPRKIVIVTDIGCIGLADQYFKTNAFHSLHGRSLTYATGLKLARPELTVIALIGDGGCGIGGAHLLSAARRNVDVTLIVANNFNYGMTGGQHSITTPLGGMTSTTPSGNIEGTIDICATVAGAGAGWVYRGIGFDKDLAERIVDGVRYPGFALLDVWGICTAHYMPRNDFKKGELYALSNASGMRTGLLANRDRHKFGEEYCATVGTRAKGLRPTVIEPAFAHALDRQIGVVMAGSAGQKVRSTATVFAQAGMLSGLTATQKDDYPITVMTGHSISEIILSPSAIEYTAIDSPDAFVVLSDDGLNKSRKWVEHLPATCTVYIDDVLSPPRTGAQLRALPLSRAAKEVGRFTASSIALSAVLKDKSFFPREALEESCRRFQKPAVADRSIAAIRKGFDII